tara:strand:- start:769 stop:1230 length:462 start_codon:yes stop_codon:yes gene_type:complete
MDNNIDTSVDTNVDSKEKVVKLSITDYAIKNGISTSTVRNWIRSGKVEWEKEKGKYLIFDYQVGIKVDNVDTNVGINVGSSVGINDLLSEKDNLIQSLQKELAEKNEQINELLRQQDQNQQIIMSMNQNQQKLLVESKRTWFQRLFGLNETEA